jgi:hypothetical protein
VVFELSEVRSLSFFRKPALTLSIRIQLVLAAGILRAP